MTLLLWLHGVVQLSPSTEGGEQYSALVDRQKIEAEMPEHWRPALAQRDLEQRLGDWKITEPRWTVSVLTAAPPLAGDTGASGLPPRLGWQLRQGTPSITVDFYQAPERVELRPPAQRWITEVDA